MGSLLLIDDVAQLAVDRPRPADVIEQPRVRLLEFLGLLVAQLLTQLGIA
jgi:hypothetical protein